MSKADDLAAKKHRLPREPKPRPSAVWICNLAESRKRLGLTIRDVAEAVGMSTAGYHAVEHGSDPMLSTARKIATFFDVPIEWLWPNVVGKQEPG